MNRRHMLGALAGAGVAVLSACASTASVSGGTAGPFTTAGFATTAGPATTGSPTAVPASLQFEATLVGGTAFSGASRAGQPTAFWFWAPT